MPVLDFWFDYSCPYAYLGSTQVDALAARTGAPLVYQPMLLGGVFTANGTPQKLFATLSAAKAAHNARDLDRWAELWGVPLTMPSGHPLRTVEALRATIATGCDPRVIHGFFRAYWVEGRGPSEEATMRDVLGAAGHDTERILEAIRRPEAKEELRLRTDRAIALGIFGAPAFVVGDQMYWGQDRLDFVERALVAAKVEGPQPSRSPRTMSTTSHTPRHTLEIYWDFSSPFAYLGSTQAEKLAERTGAKLVWRPMLLGGLFKSIGQADAPILTWSQAKQRYYFQDLARWAQYWGVPFQFPTRFPTNSLKAMRVYLALPEERRAAFREATFRAYWAEDRDIADEAVLRALVGAEADEVMARTQDPAVKKALVDGTQAAVDAGVFGAPTWIIDGKELYWGQDRIPLVERALAL